jgi:RNA polymerase sigma-70 factor (ECF subfamily)
MTPIEFEDAARASLPALTRYANRLTSGADGAEDLVQEALSRAWKARARFQAGSNFKAWTFTILRNLFLSHVRRERRQRDRANLALHSAPVSPPDQDTALLRDEFKAALEALSASHRQALLAVIEDQLAYEAAAEKCGISLAVLKSRVHRARAAILAYLAGTHRSQLQKSPQRCVYYGFVRATGAEEGSNGMTLCRAA